jgi:hypothetical protein
MNTDGIRVLLRAPGVPWDLKRLRIEDDPVANRTYFVDRKTDRIVAVATYPESRQ